MRKLSNRGTAALEFVLVAVPFFILMFGVIELGRYAVTVHSLEKLAAAQARAVMICYSGKAHDTSPNMGACATETPFVSAADVAPFVGTLTATMRNDTTAKNITVTAKLDFATVMPLLSSAFDKTIEVTSTVPY